MLRPSIPADLPNIKALVEAAFAPSTFESALVDCIFRSGDEYYGWVMEKNSYLTGFILYTKALRGDEAIGYHLAPVAVHPDFQRHGIGSVLIKSSLNSPPIAEAPVFVLGDPAFYERFGFARTANVICPYNPSNEYFRALRWKETGDHFTIDYTQSFQVAEEGNPQQ